MPLSLALLLANFALLTPAALADSAADEAATRSFRAALHTRTPPRWIPGLLGPRLTRLALDAVELALADGEKVEVTYLIPGFALNQLEPIELARWFRLGGLNEESALLDALEPAVPYPGLLYEIESLSPRLKSPRAQALLSRLRSAFPGERAVFDTLKSRAFTPPSASELRSLFFDLPDISHFQDGAYAGKPRLFLFCRHDRNFPCLLALKDQNDRPVRDADGKLWTQPGLALSGYGKPFNERMGNTPSGVHLVNGVMPEANDTYSYGKFRRMILEFPPASSGETEMKRLLPPAVHGSIWWKESPIARDVGRGALRIHGTGQHNDQPDVLFYPFIATVGCVAQREMRYGDVEYIDQRRLLDQVMKAQGLAPTFANETKIRALLYVVDIDEKRSAVSAADLSAIGIQ